MHVVDAAADIAYLESLVPVMRRFGVSSFRDVVLGPAMPADTTDPVIDEGERTVMARRQAEEREQRRRYGASGGPRPLARSDQ